MPRLDLFLPARCGAAGLVAAALLACVPFTAARAQNAGTVEFVSGDASVRASDGGARVATRGGAVVQGDTIETANGRVQLRMVDGAYISLQPQTTLRFDQYAMARADAAEEGGFMRLLRGGLRTVTGAIGRVNRSAYRISTPTSTIGIRGTEFAVHEGNSTRVNVTEGVVALCTTGGCLDIGAGQSGYAPNTTTRPTLVFAPAHLPPTAAPALLPTAAATEQPLVLWTAVVPLPVIPPPVIPPLAIPPPVVPLPVIPLANGPGGAAIAAVDGAGFTGGLLGGTLTFNAAGALTQTIDCCTATNSFTLGVSPDFGADGIIAWGRWTSGVRGGATPQLTMNYAAGLSANPVTATSIVRGYTSFASTAPTVTSGGALVATGLPNSVTGTLAVNFPSIPGSGSLSYALSIPVAGQTFSINGNASQFSGTGFLGSTSTIASTGAGCTPSCAGNIPFGNAIQGFFIGAGADRAGANYGFTSTLGQVTGAVVYK